MPKDNPCINATKAPLVLLVSADGEKKITLGAKKITKSSLLSGMTSILKASGCNVPKILSRTATLLSKIKKSEDRKGAKAKMVSSSGKVLAKAKKKAEVGNKTSHLVNVKRAELKKKAAEAELEKVEKVLSPLYEKLDKILQDSKVKMSGSLGPPSKS